MQQPSGFVHPDLPTHVCKLKKFIYELKQAPRAWFSKLSDRLLTLGFQSSKSDSSLFNLQTASTAIYILIFVDDIIVTSTSFSVISDFIVALGLYFLVKDLGPLHYFLGIEVCRTTFGLFLSQSRYISDLLTRTNMHKSKPVSTPMSSSLKLTALDGPSFEDPGLYRSVVSSLQYLTFNWPDISFFVNKACQYMHCPRAPHWQAVKHILHYLRLTEQFGLHFSSSSFLTLSAYFNADCTGCPDDRKFTGGFCIYFGKHLISWGSKKQPISFIY